MMNIFEYCYDFVHGKNDQIDVIDANETEN